jgi:hypothetical protein
LDEKDVRQSNVLLSDDEFDGSLRLLMMARVALAGSPRYGTDKPESTFGALEEMHM